MPDKTPSFEPAYHWKAIYILVGGALALEIAAFALLGWIYR
jgi:hypothetical protein